MSFSSEVKDELAKNITKSRHCQIAELAAILKFDGKIVKGTNGEEVLEIVTENASLAKKSFTLIKKIFNISTEISQRTGNGLNKNHIYVITAAKKEQIEQILMTEKISCLTQQKECEQEMVNGLVVQNSCCKRAFIRGAFLSAGSMSDPEKSYHFEIVCPSLKWATQLQEIINDFDIEAKIATRKKHYIVYLKEGSYIVDILNVMEAHIALMNFENVRIIKEMRNSVNRQVNCETANIHKTVSAAVKQIEDIRFIEKNMGFFKLPENLKEIAYVRIEYPDAALKELGTYLHPPVGKSGVNHRLRKLSEMADEIRGYSKEEETYDKKISKDSTLNRF